MNDSRIALKLGVFVAFGLALLALLILSFSRGLTLFERTYDLRIILPTAAGLKPTADVLMAGVPIGKATSLELLPDGRSVAVTVSIVSKYQIRSNAVFQIDALGFLGDQYISVTPSTNMDAGFYRDGGHVEGQSPFNMQEAVRSISGLLNQAKTMVTDADRSINNLNNNVLSAQSVSNFSMTLSNLEAITFVGLKAAEGAEVLIRSNTPVVDQMVTNLRSFSEKLNVIAADLDLLIATNQTGVHEAIQNLHDTSISVKQLAADLEAGKGVVGGLLKDDAMKAQTATLISNASAMSAAFSDFGSNLNQRGIWSMLWKPKHNEKSEKSSNPAH